MFKRCQYTALMAGFVFTIALLPFSQCRAAEVRWATDVETSLKSANESQRLVLMKFTAEWCGYCKKMERTTFADESVARLVNTRFVPVIVDADEHKDLVTHLKITGLPALLVVSPDMMILERITGYQTADRLLPKLNQALAAHQPAKSPDDGVASFKHPGTAAVAQPVSQKRPLSSPAATSRDADPFADDFDSPFGVDDFAPAVPDLPAQPRTIQRPPIQRPPVQRASQDFTDDNPFGAFEQPASSGSFDASPGNNPFADTGRSPSTNSATGADPFADAFMDDFGFDDEPQVQETVKPAFSGLCLSSVVEERRLVKGQPNISTSYRGQLLTFASEQQKQKFLATPEKYWPMLDGACAMTLLQSGRRTTGELQYAAVFRNRVWLFQSQALMQDFIAAPAEFADRIQ